MKTKRSILIVAGVLLASLCVYGCTSSAGCSRDGDSSAGPDAVDVSEGTIGSEDPGDSVTGNETGDAVPGESSGEESPADVSADGPHSGSDDTPLDPGERDTTSAPGSRGGQADASSPSHSGGPDIETSERE